MGSGHVSPRWASSFDDHFHDSFIVVKNLQLRIDQLFAFFFQLVFWFLGSVLHRFPWCYHGLVWQCCWLNVTPQLACPRNREQVTHPCVIPASREMISDSVELCETEVCFVHVQLMGTNFLLQGRQQSPSLGTNPIYNVELCCQHDNIVGIEKA